MRSAYTSDLQANSARPQRRARRIAAQGRERRPSACHAPAARSCSCAIAPSRTGGSAKRQARRGDGRDGVGRARSGAWWRSRSWFPTPTRTLRRPLSASAESRRRRSSPARPPTHPGPRQSPLCGHVRRAMGAPAPPAPSSSPDSSATRVPLSPRDASVPDAPPNWTTAIRSRLTQPSRLPRQHRQPARRFEAEGDRHRPVEQRAAHHHVAAMRLGQRRADIAQRKRACV